MHRTARLLKAINFHLNGNLLSFQVTVGRGLRLEHHGLGVVIHPNVDIGENVQIWHAVTIAAETEPGSVYRVRVGDNTSLGAGSILVGRGDVDLVIGSDVKVGAGAVVTRDVAERTTVVGSPARPVTSPIIDT